MQAINADIGAWLKETWELYKKHFTLLVAMLSGRGVIACGIGVILTAPLYTCGMAVACRRVAGGPPPLEPPPASSVPLVVDTPPAPAAPPPVGSGPAAG